MGLRPENPRDASQAEQVSQLQDQRAVGTVPEEPLRNGLGVPVRDLAVDERYRRSLPQLEPESAMTTLPSGDPATIEATFQWTSHKKAIRYSVVRK